MNNSEDNISRKAAAFSRLQLAAALIEYDNDDENPNAPRRSAQESAIFAHIRRRNPPRPPMASRRSTDYLGVPTDLDGGSFVGRESVAETRRSRASTDALKNPFGRDSTYGDLDQQVEDMEVDLASWGLDQFIPKEKGSRKQKNKEGQLPNPFPASPTGADPPTRKLESSRSASLGNLESFGQGGAFLDAKSVIPARRPSTRRHSIGTALELADSEPSELFLQPRRGSAHDLIQSIPPTPPLHSIPFPTANSIRSRSVSPSRVDVSSSDPRQSTSAAIHDPHKRTQSTASMGSRMLLNDEEELPNPFVVRPPSPSRASRFDPKSVRGRTMSGGTMGTMGLPYQTEDPNPFEVRPPSPSRASRFDPKAAQDSRRSRTMSIGTQQMFLMEDDGGESFMSREPPRERRYSRMDLMRPKVLVMPSPLQQVSAPEPPPPTAASREGFTVSHASDGRPLPPGARTASRTTMIGSLLPPPSLEVPVAANAFIPNPRNNLTLSQLTFRNTLMVDGQRDLSYGDLEGTLQRATEEGEQVNVEPEPEPEPEPEQEIPIIEEPQRKGRPPGKLFGKSLIDDLEARKAEMKGKQRVFRGDQRPSMMARTQLKRSSTLIDPESLKRPPSQHLSSLPPGADLNRRNSANIKPLLNFDDEIPGARGQHLDTGHPLPANTKSVFGVDTIWERELAKLKQIEAREKIEEEERLKREAAEESTKKKKKGKRKGKDKARDSPPIEPTPPPAPVPEPEPEPIYQRPPSPPHILPDVQKVTGRRPRPPIVDDDDDSDTSEDSQAPQNPTVNVVKDWHAGSSDEEEGPRRTTGSGPRYPNRQGKSRAPKPANDDDSEEDIPLVATIGRAAQRASRSQLAADDSDEEKPLSMFLDSAKLKIPGIPGLGDKLFGGESNENAENDEEDEDDKPLGLRASRVMPTGDQDEEDDRPLAFHPDQVRRTQYMMAAQQQQQQQQFMMQAHAAQMHQSMMFGAAPLAPMMTGGFFGAPMGAPMAPPMMMAPAPMPITPPPAHDAAKLGRIDNWRHDVAVQGQAPT